MPVFFDLETQNTFDDVGGRYPERLKLSIAVTYDDRTDRWQRFTEATVADLIAQLQQADRVVGFNLLDFDYLVLKAYTTVDLRALPTVDMLAIIARQLGYRVSLDALAAATLGEKKSADGLQAVRWWRTGRLEELFRYCEQDVLVTRRLYEFGRQYHYVQFYDKRYRLQRVPVNW